MLIILSLNLYSIFFCSKTSHLHYYTYINNVRIVCIVNMRPWVIGTCLAYFFGSEIKVIHNLLIMINIGYIFINACQRLICQGQPIFEYSLFGLEYYYKNIRISYFKTLEITSCVRLAPRTIRVQKLRFRDKIYLRLW